MSTHFRHGAAQKSRGIGSAKKAALKAAFKFIGKLTYSSI